MRIAGAKLNVFLDKIVLYRHPPHRSASPSSLTRYCDAYSRRENDICKYIYIYCLLYLIHQQQAECCIAAQICDREFYYLLTRVERIRSTARVLHWSIVTKRVVRGYIMLSECACIQKFFQLACDCIREYNGISHHRKLLCKNKKLQRRSDVGRGGTSSRSI